MISSYQVLALGAIAALGYLISRRDGRDPREPPVVGTSIPVFGHLLGLLKHGAAYFSILAKQHPSLPVLCIDLFLTKVYLVNSPTMLQAVQRNKGTLSFDPFITFTAERAAGIKGRGLELLREKKAGGGGVNQAINHAMHPTLTGKPLDRMNERMVKFLTPLIDELAKLDRVDLYAWCTHAITLASTEASYGPLNPYRDRKIEDAFWAYENNLSPLLAGFLPSLIARPAYQGRETAVPAFIAYYAANGHKQGSELTQARFNAQFDAGMDVADIARLEVSMGIGLLSNTVPACFWIIFDLFSRPKLLAEIREEVEKNALRITDENEHIVSIPALRDNCPLFVSTYQEILRSRSASSPTRHVQEDTVLADTYVLKKGNTLSIPSLSMSGHQDVWGESAREFNPRRYLKPDNTINTTSSTETETTTTTTTLSTAKSHPRRTGGLMTFGVSPVVCPGRHFASSEILAIVAMLMLRFEFSPLDLAKKGEGEWKEPPKNSLAISSAMGPVKGEFNVHVRERDGFRGVKWEVEAREGSGVFNLMVG